MGIETYGGNTEGKLLWDICLTGWHPLNLVSNLDQYLCLLDITSRVSCCSGAPSRCHYLGHFLQWQLKVSAVLENLVVNISECDAMFMWSDRKTFSCNCWLMLQWNLPIITTTSLLGCGIFFIYFFLFLHNLLCAFNALILLLGHQEEQPVCKNSVMRWGVLRTAILCLPLP